jgi:NAD(P)-dependent dehydrogenase (short-subunit alcohol dehydrogenase family)
MTDGYIIVTVRRAASARRSRASWRPASARVAGLTVRARRRRRGLRVRRRGRGRHRQGRGGGGGARADRGLVNNAGVYEEHKSDRVSAADFERVMRTNATSVVVASREVYPHLKQAGGGLIVNIGSFFDKMGVSRSVAYCASKAAIGRSRAASAVEWAADNIRVIDVAPGYIATDLNAEFREKESVKTWIRRRIPVARAGAAEGGGAAGRQACSAPTSAS